MNQFALVVSITHLIADAATFFKVVNMLSFDAEIVTLNPYRPPHSVLNGSIISKKYPPSFSVLQSPLALFAVALSFIRAIPRLLFGSKPKFISKTIDPRWVETEKQKHLQSIASSIPSHPAVPYISTNDCITSWFFKTTRSNVGMLSMNLRGKMPGILQHFAGNYLTVLFFNKSQFGAANVRQCVNSTVQQQQQQQDHQSRFTFPWSTCWKEALKIAFVSSWTAFYERDLNLGSDAEFLAMHPLTTLHEAMPRGGVIELCLVYKVREGVTAVLVDNQFV
ncbi:hypothetical protein BDR26DRAFT_590734 [Obelidium mucronatum]|nr:hypothetical protein BDR26DRAFT_590734 [Obelidium mucronatum]